MNGKRETLILVTLLLAMPLAEAVAGPPGETAFTYQGQLKREGAPVNCSPPDCVGGGKCRGASKGRISSAAPADLAVSTVQGISATDTDAWNLRGSFAISEAEPSEFDVPEPDAAYFLSVTPTAIGCAPQPCTPAPAAGSNRIKRINKTANGFTIHLEVAPGAGQSVTFDWILIR